MSPWRAAGRAVPAAAGGAITPGADGAGRRVMA